MSRPLRIEYAGALYHVTSRGNQKNDIYLTDNDRLNWIEVLSNVCERFNWRCHAWCLMDNHYHIVIETIEGNLSKGMRQLNGVYTQKMNRNNHRVGHVFQGRYKAIIIDKESYLLELSRYVVLNPVRAKMVNDALDWKWSSYRAMIGKDKIPSWLETDWLLSHFHRQKKKAQNGYINFVRAGVGLEPIWQQVTTAGFLADQNYIDEVKEKYSIKGDTQLKEYSRLERRALAKPLTYYLEKFNNKKEGMAKAYQTGNYSMKEISDYFKVHYSTVSRAVNNHEMLDCKTPFSFF